MTVEQLLSECDLVRLTEENAIGTEGSVSPNVRWKWDDVRWMMEEGRGFTQEEISTT